MPRQQRVYSLVGFVAILLVIASPPSRAMRDLVIRRLQSHLQQVTSHLWENSTTLGYEQSKVRQSLFLLPPSFLMT